MHDRGQSGVRTSEVERGLGLNDHREVFDANSELPILVVPRLVAHDHVRREGCLVVVPERNALNTQRQG